jgi:hypothetical protein
MLKLDWQTKVQQAAEFFYRIMLHNLAALVLACC